MADDNLLADIEPMTKPDRSGVAESFDDIDEGDRVKIPGFNQEFEVTEKMESIGNVELEGPRGGEKALVQNENNPEDVALLSGGRREGPVDDIEIL